MLLVVHRRMHQHTTAHIILLLKSIRYVLLYSPIIM